MVCHRLKKSVLVFIFSSGVLISGLAYAGSSAIGLVAGSIDATLGGELLLPNTMIFDGDTLRVRDGVTVVTLSNSSRMAFGQETVASFSRKSNEVTVLLGQGNVSIYHSGNGEALKVKAGDVTITPAEGFKTLGEVAMVGPTVVVTSKEGLLRVEGSGSAQNVTKGKTIAVPAKAAKGPPTGATGAAQVRVNTVLNVAGLAASANGAVFSGIAFSRANDAKKAAASASQNAKAAVAADQAAAASAAQAVIAANSAAAAAQSAQVAVVSVGCSLNKSNPQITPSPFTPPTGFTCPP